MNKAVVLIAFALVSIYIIRKGLKIRTTKENLWDLRASVYFSGSATLLLCIIVFLLPEISAIPKGISFYVGVVFLILLLTWFCLLMLLEHLRRSEHEGTMTNVMRANLQDSRSAFNDTLNNLPKAIAPKGWREIREPDERIISGNVKLRTFLKLYVWVFVAIFPIGAIGMWVEYDQLEEDQRQIFGLSIQYNILLIATIATLAAVIFLACTIICDKIGIIQFPIDYVSMVNRVASWVGAGTLMGVLAASLYPAMLSLLHGPAPDGFSDNISDAIPVSANILITGPAGGAIVGYIFGIVALAFSLGKAASNIVYRFIVFPAGYFIALWTVITHIVSPQRFWISLQQLTEEEIEDAHVICSIGGVDSSNQHSTDYFNNTSNIFRYCGDELILPDTFVIIAFGTILLVLSLYCFVSKLRENIRSQTSPDRPTGATDPQ